MFAGGGLAAVLAAAAGGILLRSRHGPPTGSIVDDHRSDVGIARPDGRNRLPGQSTLPTPPAPVATTFGGTSRRLLRVPPTSPLVLRDTSLQIRLRTHRTCASCAEQADPREGAKTMRAKIVLGGGGRLTDGMNIWPRLGWHELVVYGMLRAACCPGTPQVELPHFARQLSFDRSDGQRVGRLVCIRLTKSRR